MGSLQICNIGNDILIINFISGYAYEVSRFKNLLFLLHWIWIGYCLNRTPIQSFVNYKRDKTDT